MKLFWESVPPRQLKVVPIYLFFLLKHLYYASNMSIVHAEDTDIARLSNERLLHCYRGKNPSRKTNIASAVWAKFRWS